MHPSVKLPSGDMKCPICFMDLIPLEEGSAEGDIPELRLSDRARFLAEVETSPVDLREVTKTLRLVGKIRPAETRLSMITAWVPGRLERLFVDYTGMQVREGDHLVEIYSPELYSAQQELLQARASFGEMGESGSQLLAQTSQSLIASSRQKLIRLGLTEEQVDKIVEKGEAEDTITIYSPTSGIVTARNGTEGMYVEEGSMIYTIADLSEVWLILDAYESDLVWLHYGQQVRFQTEAFPGEEFSGTLSFISPVMDEQSRTIKLRVNVDNPDLRLKPGMFASARIAAHPAAGGKVLSPELAGSWMCPMHPEEISDLFGFCSICGMPLEKAEELGYSVAGNGGDLPLVIPDTAPLITGTRAVVYVEKMEEGEPVYEGREVELGPHADGFYVVESGLEPGQRVVTRGNFKIDSALQIQAKPSMMSYPGGTSLEREGEGREEPKRYQLPEPLADSFSGLLQTYLHLQTALADDASSQAFVLAASLENRAKGLPEADADWEGGEAWMRDRSAFLTAAENLAETSDFSVFRERFAPLSSAVHDLLGHFGNPTGETLKWTFCPMALQAGAHWIQSSTQIANPYYGEAMLRCGEFQGNFPPLATGGGS
jgi:Cu(I)/Ag(I) efflux system membrane fusion protein